MRPSRLLTVSLPLCALLCHLPLGAGAALDKAFIRSTHPALSDADFEIKWKSSLASPMMFIRSYPAAFHRSLAAAKPPMGGEVICIGDAHPGNFGFVLVDGKTLYAANDFDEAGWCPIAWDALRYFTALRLFFDDDGLTKDILEKYVDVVKDAGRADAIPGSFVPKWKKVREDGLAKYAKKDQLASAELVAATASEQAGIAAAFKADARLKGYKIVSVGKIDRDLGGSAGLLRYWVLVDSGGQRSIVELKEITKPGTEWGLHGKTIPLAQRMETLKRAFWGRPGAGDYFLIALGKSTFMVRDRFTKKSLATEELGNKDRKDALKAQASWLALYHAAGWGGVKKDDLRAWLWDASKAQAEIWKAAYKAGKR